MLITVMTIELDKTSKREIFYNCVNWRTLHLTN